MASTNSNIWEDIVPEEALRSVLAGETVVADIGQVNGLWKRMLNHEVKAGRLTKWRGKWFPTAGAKFGMGPDKDCYGTPEVYAHLMAISDAEAQAHTRTHTDNSPRA